MKGTRKFLEELLDIDIFYCGGLTVENAVHILGWEIANQERVWLE